MKSSSNVIRGSARGLVGVTLGESIEGRSVFSPFPAAPRTAPAPQKLAHECALQAAYERGLSEGLAEAGAQAESEMEGMRATLDLVVRELWGARARMHQEIEEDVCRLAMEVAAKVVGEAARKEGALVERTVSEALRRVAVRDRIALRVNPEDLEAVRAQRERWLSLVEGVEHFEIVEDRRVGRGGALVTTLGGSVDARWTTQLQEIERALFVEKEKS